MFLDVFFVLVMFLVTTPLFSAGTTVSVVAAVDAVDEGDTGMFWLSVVSALVGTALTLGSIALGIVLLVGLF